MLRKEIQAALEAAVRARFGLDELDFEDIQNIRLGVEKHRRYTKFIDADE